MCVREIDTLKQNNNDNTPLYNYVSQIAVFERT